MKRITALLFTVILLCSLFSGCSSSSADNYSYNDSYAKTESADFSSMNYEANLSVSTNDAFAPVDTTLEVPASGTGSTTSSSSIERKIIKDADITMEAEDAHACYASILDTAKKLGGYESTCTTRETEYNITVSATLKLPPEKLDEFMTKTGEFGKVTYSTVSADEITETYYDLQTRMNTKQASLDRYYELLAKAETVEEIINIQQTIDSITEEIESIKGRLRVYDALVDESTVNISISQEIVIPVEEKEFEWNSLTFSSFCKLIKNGFLSVCNFVWSMILWILIIAVSVLPLAVIAGAVVYLIIRNKRKKKNVQK